jgi:tripartite ATP-independent transporter DctP family solute receptor
MPGWEQEHWRFAIEETQGSVQDAYAQRFKQLIEERSDGEIQVDVYPYGTLGTSDQVTELLGMGTVQFAMASPGHMGTLIPEVQVFLLHFVLSEDPAVNQEVLSDPGIVATFDDLYAEKGLELLSIYQEGWMVWTTQKPIRTPEDFKGVKIRVMTSPLLLAAYKEYGASPTPLPYGEVYSALQLNMIDAQVNPIFAIQEMSFYEVTDYLIFGGHAPYITTAVTNRDFMEGLSPERRAMVKDVIAELDDYIFEKQRDYNEKRLDMIKESKPSIKIIDDLTDQERAVFRDASMAVREQFVDIAGPRGREVLDQLIATVKKKQGDS